MKRNSLLYFCLENMTDDKTQIRPEQKTRLGVWTKQHLFGFKSSVLDGNKVR